MSIYRGKVNQKLFFARLLADEFDHAADAHHQRLRLESLLFQLYLAYHFHLRHIAASYQCRAPEDVHAVDDLVQQLAAGNKSPAEAAEIQALLGAPGGWLKPMLAAYRACLGASQDTPGGVAEGLIPVAQVDGPEEFTVDTARQWLQGLTELVERQRDTMVEY
ncbi:MAG: DUF6586 family protein [Porticoccaceae bacterium]